MQLQLNSRVAAEVVPDRMLDYLPRWGIEAQTVKVGPYQNSTEHEQHVLNTLGSGSWLWSKSDELRFDNDDRTLRSVLMFVPEVNHILVYGNPERWVDTKYVQGLPHLETPVDFTLEVSASRYLTSDGGALMCVWGSGVAPPAETFRLRIAIDFDLIFAKGKLCGWMLSRPAHYVVSSWEHPLPTAPSQHFIDLLREYLAIVAEPQLEEMEKGDLGFRDALLRLLDRVHGEVSRDRRSRVLAGRIESVLETFYGRAS